MIKPFLLLQSRPEDSASDSEYKAFCHFGGLNSNELERLRLDTGTYPKIDLNKYSGIILLMIIVKNQLIKLNLKTTYYH